MKVRTEIATNYSITLTEEELQFMVENPAKAWKIIRKEIERSLAETPRLMSGTVARPRVNTKTECPICHLMFEERGLGVHMFRRHNTRLPEYKSKHPELQGMHVSLLPTGTPAPKT